MKKQEFLEELKQYLHVLADEEQEDILQEYEQHIEMKIEKGLSEEEAIRDFGSVRELAGEILEAYHVKLDVPGGAKENLHQKRLKEWKLKSPRLSGGFVKIQLKKAGKGVWQGLRKLWAFVRKPFCLLKKALHSGQEKIKSCKWHLKNIENKEMPQSRNKEEQIEKIREKRMKKRMVFPMMVKGIKQVAYGIFCMVCWCLRLIWNCGVLFAAVFSAFMGLVFLYLFGALFVLWRQGYPLGGVVLGCMGAVLCFFSLAVFGCTFYRNKPSLEQKAEQMKHNADQTGEVQGIYPREAEQETSTRKSMT